MACQTLLRSLHCEMFCSVISHATAAWASLPEARYGYIRAIPCNDIVARLAKQMRFANDGKSSSGAAP